ncbi:hypothetical protein LguiA_002408 [Lonicera macranthoides]
MALPKYFVLKSNYNKKYLEFVKEDGEVHGLNKFYGENPAVRPYAKYEIVTAKTGGSEGIDKDQCDVFTITDWELQYTLPRDLGFKYFVLKSNYNQKYLEYVKEDVEVHGLNKFSRENPVSPYGKYEIEKAKTGDRLVHIKCCYNNKYFVRWSPSHYWIAAAANKPEEDESKWSCTLFEMLPIDAKMIRFHHIQLGHYACLWRLGSENVYDSCLFAGVPECWLLGLLV